MKVWILDADVDTYENLELVNEQEYDYLGTLDGESKKNSWKPMCVKRM